MKDASVIIYTDGASRGNPGDSAWAYMILNNGTVVAKKTEFCGYATNNQAEYFAIINALSDAAEKGFKKIILYSDSELVVRQLKGEYKVRDSCLRQLYMKATGIIKAFDSVSFTNVPRSDRNIAIVDKMCNETLDRVKKGDKTPVPEIFDRDEICLRPVGIVRSSYTGLKDAPRQGRLSEELAEIHIFPEYADALHTIEKCTHLVVLCWFNKAERSILRATPPGQREERGVFAIRSPGRPNPIALDVVDLVQVRGTVLTVRGLDAINHTPVLDIKPVIDLDNVQTTKTK